jgi:hypothetical protein
MGDVRYGWRSSIGRAIGNKMEGDWEESDDESVLQ